MVRRQVLPAKPSPQKGIHDSNNNQIETQKMQTITILNGDQQANQIKNVFEFIKKLWKHCQLMKNSFKGS